MDSLLVPSSIQRIRSFLIEMCGMKVKPWASTEETLAALHSTLVARHRCGIFWDSLGKLLVTLARDLKARAEASPDKLIDNEVLDSGHYARLLDEIRDCLARQGSVKTSFRQLASGLSAPALGLLLLLGGAASIGCDRSSLRPGPGGADAAVAAETSGKLSDTAPAPSPDTGPSTDADAQTVSPADATSPSPPDIPATRADARPDLPPDGPPRIVLPDTAPPSGPDATTRGADGGAVTIQDIMDSCKLPSSTQAQVLACLKKLNDSWSTGMAEVLATASCTTVNYDLECFTYSTACIGRGAPDFVAGLTKICDPIIIYAGVRFV